MTPEEYRLYLQQQQQAQQQQQGGVPPVGMISQFTGGAPAGGAGGGGGAIGSAGPWAALAAAIIANESVAKKQGRRPDSEEKHMTDLLSGKVLEYDADALADKVDGTSSPMAEAIRFGGKAGNPEGIYEMAATGVKNDPLKKLWEFLT